MARTIKKTYTIHLYYFILLTIFKHKTIMKKIMTLAAIFAAVMMGISSCNPDDTKPEQKPGTEQGGENNGGEQGGENNGGEEGGENNGGEQTPGGEDEYASPVTIDGDFADWDALDASKVVVLESAADAVYTAITKAKIYADGVYINIYFEFDEEQITAGGAAFDIYLNADGDDGLGDDYYVGQTGVDYLLEDGEFMTAGTLNSFNPGLFAYEGSREAWEWGWVPVLDSGLGIASGAGAGNKYELAVMIEMLAGVELADTFSLGLMLTDITEAGDWNCVGCLPNTDVTEENTNGKAPFAKVTLDK